MILNALFLFLNQNVTITFWAKFTKEFNPILICKKKIEDLVVIILIGMTVKDIKR